jgi:hypothetical protein
MAAPLVAIARATLFASLDTRTQFTMPPKRKGNESEPTGRELKKQKIEISRTIHVQSIDPAAAESTKSVKFDSESSDPSCRKNEASSWSQV